MSTKKPATPPKSELAGTDTLDRGNTNAKLQALEEFRSDATGQALRTNQGVKISDNQNSLKVGARGRRCSKTSSCVKKITHFDHERIPAHRACPWYGRPWLFPELRRPFDADQAGFLRTPEHKTPVFARFPRCRARVVPATPCVTCAVLP